MQPVPKRVSDPLRGSGGGPIAGVRSLLTQHLRQLGDVGSDPPRLILREELASSPHTNGEKEQIGGKALSCSTGAERADCD